VVDDNKEFGDERFIYQMAREDDMPHTNNILDGYIIINEEKIPFARKPLLDGWISILMPEAFVIMPKELAEKKYPSIQRPDEIYTNNETTINLTLSLKNDKAANEDIPNVKDTVQQVMMRMYPASRIIDSEIIEVSGINIAYFDLSTPALDMDIYNTMFFFSIDNRVVVGSFNCPWENMDIWKPVVVQMLGTVEMIVGE
jgi:hypothetical protein